MKKLLQELFNNIFLFILLTVVIIIMFPEFLYEDWKNK